MYKTTKHLQAITEARGIYCRIGGEANVGDIKFQRQSRSEMWVAGLFLSIQDKAPVLAPSL